VQGCETQLGRPRQDITPEGTRTHPRRAGISIDFDAAEAGRAHQHGVGERTKRHRIVSGALGGDPLAVGGRGTDNIAHVVGATRHRNAGGLLVDQDIEDARSRFQSTSSVVNHAAAMPALLSLSGFKTWP